MKFTQWACLFFALSLLSSCSRPPVEIPGVEEIAEMHVDIEIDGIIDWGTQKNSERQKFSPAMEHWTPILNAFQPSERAGIRKKGYVPGEITLKLKDGTSFRLKVLSYGKPDVMYFWLGPEHVAHSGGSPRGLRDALNLAYAASQGGEQD